MSASEIQYLVNKESQAQGDTEAIINAMGAYQNEISFRTPQEVIAHVAAGESIMLRLIRTSSATKPDYELREDCEKMRKGVESHYTQDSRERLSRLFVGIAFSGASETE